VNDPKIKKWLNQVVGKEGEDLSRHDKWLCMMYPRLKLLQRLLSDDGAIFVSIDDNENANLRLICDEIFGERNFKSCISWQKRYTRSNNTIEFTTVIEYILVYAKSPDFSVNLLPRTDSADNRYTNPDNDPRGVWKGASFLNPATPEQRPNLCYPITNPNTGIVTNPTTNAWRRSQDVFEQLRKENKLYWGIDGKSNVPAVKMFLSEARGLTPINLWTHDYAGNTDQGTLELAQIFAGKVFNNPKPSSLIYRVLEHITGKDSIILDSFAGSGTTAHAVLNLNKQDGGNRNFILVEMEDYAETITAERVRRVIDGYAGGEGTGGSFDFYELGEPMILKDGNLNENVPVERIREYVFYMETKCPLPKMPDIPILNQYYLGRNANTDYYFYYERDRVTTLDRAFWGILNSQAEGYVIYADKCKISTEDLKKFGVMFKKIPRDIARL
jgi:adenine-specific DNA-methyltransferase